MYVLKWNRQCNVNVCAHTCKFPITIYKTGQEAMSSSRAQILVSLTPYPTEWNKDSSENRPDSRAGAEKLQDEPGALLCQKVKKYSENDSMSQGKKRPA